MAGQGRPTRSHDMATINLANGLLATIQQAHDLSSTHDGDTLLIPPGQWSWTTAPLVLTKTITLQGATTINTTTDTIPSPGLTASASDLTVLIDNISPRGNSGMINPRPGGGLVTWPGTTTPAGIRIMGITFGGGVWGGITASGASNGCITPWSSYHNMLRVSQCHFDDLMLGPCIQTGGSNFGVMDHCWVKHHTGEGFGHIWFVEYTVGTDNGDAAWLESAGLGGPKFFFIEDCYGSECYLAADGRGPGFDTTASGKVVIRHCKVYNGDMASHGLGQTLGNWNCGRAVECYNNEWHYRNSIGPGHGMDASNGLVFIAHDNTYFDNKPAGYSLSSSYRSIHAVGNPFRGASGGNPWDLNDVTDQTGNGFGGSGPGGLYSSGTVTSATSNSITDNTKNWPVNHWVNYNVRRASDEQTHIITSNTATTLTLHTYDDGNQITSGPYEIRKCLRVMEQAACGQWAAQINRAAPAWPGHGLEPCYAWNNIFAGDGTPVVFRISWGEDKVIEGRDYFNSPMPGYSPYTYPHPLVSSASVTRVISLSGTGLAFGNVVIGSVSPTGTVTVSNTGNSLLTVTSVGYSSGFSGPTGGFTVPAGGSVDITVTFTPLLAQLYSGTITVVSDATSGSNTITASGTGIDPTQPVHGHKKQARYAFGV